MIKFIRTTGTDPHFQYLVDELDKYLAIGNGNTNDFYVQYNKLDQIKHVVIVCNGDTPIACGAIKKYDNETIEIKRMFVREEVRGRGIASKILTRLENWAKEMNYKKCILETGTYMNKAISLYKKANYNQIPNYGQYKDIKTSVCFMKNI